MPTENQIAKNLCSIKIKEKYIIIHSDISGLVFKNFSLARLWKIIFNFFGKDKIYILPTFTFNFNKKKLWDYYKSKSETGIIFYIFF